MIPGADFLAPSMDTWNFDDFHRSGNLKTLYYTPPSLFNKQTYSGH